MAAAVLVPGVRRFTEVEINVVHVSNVDPYEGLLRETAKQLGVTLSMTLVTCIRWVRAKGAYDDFLSDGSSSAAPFR